MAVYAIVQSNKFLRTKNLYQMLPNGKLGDLQSFHLELLRVVKFVFADNIFIANFQSFKVHDVLHELKVLHRISLKCEGYVFCCEKLVSCLHSSFRTIRVNN